jgi:DNA-3-methyladenine glycosylase
MRLTRDFFERPTLNVARDLLGKALVRRLGSHTLSGMIVETEAYIGPDDLACHASKGRTARTAIMFGPAGVAYIYMIYGVYFCLNVVTETEGYPAAVLIRAVEPIENVAVMRKLRKNPKRDIDIASGPGKLCMAMGIDKTLNGSNLTGSAIWIEDRNLSRGDVESSPRIGVDYAGAYQHKPWRLFVKGNPHVSRGGVRTLN